MPLVKKHSSQLPIADKKKHVTTFHIDCTSKEAKTDHNYSLNSRKDDTDKEKPNLTLVESNSETKLRKIQNKLRSGVTKSETLLDMVAKCYSLHAPIEEKPCGDDASGVREKRSEDAAPERKEFRSVSPCLTDPNSTALVQGSPQSSNVAFEGLDDGNDIVDELEDPLLAGWDDEDLFLYRTSEVKPYLKTHEMDGFANLSSGGDEDKFSSCYDDTDSEVDVMFCGFDKGRKSCKGKVEMTSLSRKRECERGQRSTSAPGLSNQRPATPWPVSQTGEELLIDRAGGQKAKILKTILVSSLIAILAFFWFPWYE